MLTLRLYTYLSTKATFQSIWSKVRNKNRLFTKNWSSTALFGTRRSTVCSTTKKERKTPSPTLLSKMTSRPVSTSFNPTTKVYKWRKPTFTWTCSRERTVRCTTKESNWKTSMYPPSGAMSEFPLHKLMEKGNSKLIQRKEWKRSLFAHWR